MYELKIKSVDQGAAADAGSLSVDPQVLGGKVRSRLVHKACVMYAANRRVGTHKTKTRSEIAGSNRKPWKQKGTGRARAGTRRSPIWRGGGTIFGPQPRDYSYALPKKALRRATQSALLSKLRDEETTIVQAFPATGKTKDVVGFLKALGIQDRAMLVTADRDDLLVRAARNLQNVAVRPVAELNAYDLLFHKRLVITAAALEKALADLGDVVKAGASEEARS